MLPEDVRDRVFSRNIGLSQSHSDRMPEIVRVYSVAQVDELVAALEFIADEHGRANKTLQMLQLEAKKQVVA